ncbi:MAG: type II toxin-antitoxin system RelE/ParE family toxin [Verrucomicrobia bacterium]|nr:type II toxin-antitoxin system RelE/ParE family toxin [Verrucomicrobiota bacterium]
MAVSDLEQIVRYIARDDPAAAERFGCRLTQRAWSLAQPQVHNSGGALRKRPGVRKLIEGNYLILYRVFTDQNKVRVLRFWHGARDPKSLRLDQ